MGKSGTITATLLLSWATAQGVPTVYPTGTTIYDPEQAWNGYTVFITPDDSGVKVIDMNGIVVKTWTGYHGGAGGPARVLPGGHVVAPGPVRSPHQESNRLFQQNWEGDIVWAFDRTAQVESDEEGMMWSARQHHDWQREGFPAGYYSPGAEPMVEGGRTLILAHQNLAKPEVTDRRLEDDYLVEVSWDGEKHWEWNASDHIGEFGFSGEARQVIRQAPGFNEARGSFDWLHINSATYVGPNRWYDDGDERFDPRNVIISSRQANIIAIIDRDDGAIVWRMGPDYRETAALAEIGQVIGQHHPHLIPRGLPGAGNLLVFDNGGDAGYGFANPVGPDGTRALGRGHSRVLEINPVTLEVAWSYAMPGLESYRFYSHYVSSAQRLPNGNTLITEGADGRLFEVTREGEIVWEYVSPFFEDREDYRLNRVYRAYRLPYDWIPQLAEPDERAVVPPDVTEFRIAPQ